VAPIGEEQTGRVAKLVERIEEGSKNQNEGTSRLKRENARGEAGAAARRVAHEKSRDPERDRPSPLRSSLLARRVRFPGGLQEDLHTILSNRCLIQIHTEAGCSLPHHRRKHLEISPLTLWKLVCKQDGSTDDRVMHFLPPSAGLGSAGG
jgi:hypothetical protein